MKKFFLTSIILSICFSLVAQSNEPIDSVPKTLDEVVVQGSTQIEGAKKTILYPTRLEKQHSTNGYQLLSNMNLPDLTVDPQSQTIQTIAGQNVIVLINGIEAQVDELATLPASDIISIDYQRNPGGKYVGKGAVMNFITRQYEYGGNVYLSAEEGLIRQYGKYTGMVNYKRKAVNFSLTTSGSWGNTSMLNSSDNLFSMYDGILLQTVSPVENKTRNNSEYARLKFAHTANNHALEISTVLTRTATPSRHIIDAIDYKFISYSSVLVDDQPNLNFNSVAERSSNERAISPKLVVDYSLSLPKNQYLWMLGYIQYGHTNYRSDYAETGITPFSLTRAELLVLPTIFNHTIENSLEFEGGLFYQKSFKHSITASINLDDYYTHYRDKYISETTDIQTLTNNNWQATATFQQVLDNGLSYFMTAGFSGLTTNLGEVRETQISPVAIYNLSYALKGKHRLNVNGHYLHTVYDPSYKNDATIHTSFFESTVGNPHLKPIKVFQNTVSYNGRFGKFGVSATYDAVRYTDNTSNRYFVEDNIVYKQLVNDGNFTYHKFIVGATLNLLENRLKLNARETYSINRFNSTYRPASSKDWRFAADASYMFGDWQVKGVWSPAFKGTGADDGERFRMSAQYGIILNWKHGNWAAECTVKNFLHRYRSERQWVDYGCVQRVSDSLSDAIGRNVSVTLTYTIPYGRHTDRDEDTDIPTSINSAILRPF